MIYKEIRGLYLNKLVNSTRTKYWKDERLIGARHITKLNSYGLQNVKVKSSPC